MKNKKVIIIVCMVVVISIGVILGTYTYNKQKAYNSLIKSANEYMVKEEYDEAIALFKQALDYKFDDNIQRNIILAKNLKEEKEIYDGANKFIEDKKYLEAIEELNKITRKDSKFYKKAKEKIEECKKEFIDINIKKAEVSAEDRKYQQAKKYLDDILKVDENNSEAIGLKDYYEKKERKEKEEHKITKEQNAVKITIDEACILATKYANHKGDNTKFKYDHEDKKGGVEYYVIQAFDDMGDHVATSGWYYVDKSRGKVYEWDLASDKLIPLN